MGSPPGPLLGRGLWLASHSGVTTSQQMFLLLISVVMISRIICSSLRGFMNRCTLVLKPVRLLGGYLQTLDIGDVCKGCLQGQVCDLHPGSQALSQRISMGTSGTLLLASVPTVSCSPFGKTFKGLSDIRDFLHFLNFLLVFFTKSGEGLLLLPSLGGS